MRTVKETYYQVILCLDETVKKGGHWGYLESEGFTNSFLSRIYIEVRYVHD